MATKILTRGEAVKFNQVISTRLDKVCRYPGSVGRSDDDALDIRCELIGIHVDLTNYLNGHRTDGNGWLFRS
jgi:hypothetical protein